MTSYYTFIVLIFFVCYNLDGDCMNNRGFTLIEITCVILLLGILVRTGQGGVCCALRAKAYQRSPTAKVNLQAGSIAAEVMTKVNQRVM